MSDSIDEKLVTENKDKDSGCHRKSDDFNEDNIEELITCQETIDSLKYQNVLNLVWLEEQVNKEEVQMRMQKECKELQEKEI